MLFRSLPEVSRGDAVRIRFFGMLYRSILVQNRAARGLIAFAVKKLINRYRRYLESQRQR